MKELCIKGFGTSTGLITLAITAPQIESGLRIASLVVGLAVGILTVIGIIRKWNK